MTKPKGKIVQRYTKMKGESFVIQSLPKGKKPSDKVIMQHLRQLVARQKDDCFFKPEYASEMFLQMHIRKLHQIIEGEFYGKR